LSNPVIHLSSPSNSAKQAHSNHVTPGFQIALHNKSLQKTQHKGL